MSEATTSWPALAELATRYGIGVDYWDWQGNHTPIPITTTQAVLRTFGVPCENDDEVRAAIAEFDLQPWRRLLPPIVVVREGESRGVMAHVPHGHDVSVDLVTEAGDVVMIHQWEHNVDPREVDGTLIGEAEFGIPADLPLGYHTLRATCGQQYAEALVIVAPHRLDYPESLGQQAWGLMAQLYSVRSHDSWGLGDFSDLASLAAWGGDLGAEFVLVNPLHAGEVTTPMENSPYLPTSRRFLNPIYLRVEDIEDFADLDNEADAAIKDRIEELGAAQRAGNAGADLLDRDTVWLAKREALRLLFGHGLSPQRREVFADYRRSQGEPLTQFATWCAIAEYFQSHPTDDGAWPADVSSYDAPGVAALAAQLADDIEFYCWLQWVTDEQLGAAQAVALASGMKAGVVTDLAVGVHPAGAEVWTLGEILAKGVSVGAPPDAFNQLGQDWSQPPWRPDTLAEAGYAPYREMLRMALKHSGGVRIDHVMGLFRLWCIPHGAAPSQGAYLRYDHEALVSILLLEAHRAGAFVVGEDLGVVEPWVREYLAERGVLGTSILWFEVDGDHPKPPEHYRELCLASVSTHDLPPTAGYLELAHVKLRHELGLLTRPLDDELGFARGEIEMFLADCRARGLLAEGASEEQTVQALHRLLGQAPSRLLGVMVADLVGEHRTQNQPGTSQEYPNWRVPLTGPAGQAVLIDELSESHRARDLAGMLNEVVRRRSTRQA